VLTDAQGFVVTDEQQRTSNPQIFAAGDASGAPQYVYVAAAGGRVPALNALGVGGTEPAPTCHLLVQQSQGHGP
jgi:mercuric reductase